MSILKTRIGRHHCAAAAVAAGIAGSVEAAVVRWNCNLVIPATVSGLYISIENQIAGTSGQSAVGWDFQLYTAGSTPSLSIFCAVGSGSMRQPGVIAGPPASLLGGTTVGPASNFAVSAWEVIFANSNWFWRTNATNYFGIRYVGNDGSTRYAYGRLDVGSTPNIRTLVWIDRETNANTAITVVPAPGALALLGLSGLARRRRRR